MQDVRDLFTDGDLNLTGNCNKNNYCGICMKRKKFRSWHDKEVD